MALNFPNSPANGDIYQALGRGWKYNSTASAWESLIRVNTAFDSDDITEGATNLYQNPENIQDEVNNLLQQGNNITLVYDDAANTMTISAVGSNTASDLLPDQNDFRDIGSTTLKWKDLHMAGDAIIDGNLTVNGTTTTINSTTLDVDDLNITIASGAADSAAADGAGITVDGASATLTYSSTGDKWVFNKAPFYNTNALLTDIVQDTTPQLGGNLETNGNNIVGGNGDKIELISDGTTPFIDVRGGSGPYIMRFRPGTNFTDTAGGVDIKYRTNPDDLLIERSENSNKIAEFGGDDGHAALYFDNAMKLETSNTGITVTGNVEATQQVISTIATGTAPLSVTSTTKVSNLNADLLDGKHASDINIEAIAFAIALG